MEGRFAATTDRSDSVDSTRALGRHVFSWRDLYSGKTSGDGNSARSHSSAIETQLDHINIPPLDWGLHADSSASYKKWRALYEANSNTTNPLIYDATHPSSEYLPVRTNATGQVRTAAEESVTSTSSDKSGVTKETEKAVTTDPASYFMTQFYDKTWNPNGPPFSNDCGPTSVAMAVLRYGKEFPGGNPADSADLIATARKYAGGGSSSKTTNLTELTASAKSAGLKVEPVRGMDAIDSALKAGKSIILVGNPSRSYEPDLGAANYGSSGGSDHLILVVENTADGNYVVCDPLSRTGPLTLSEKQLKAYCSNVSGGNTPQSGLALSP